jgi:hypothetical protein
MTQYSFYAEREARRKEIYGSTDYSRFERDGKLTNSDSALAVFKRRPGVPARIVDRQANIIHDSVSEAAKFSGVPVKTIKSQVASKSPNARFRYESAELNERKVSTGKAVKHLESGVVYESVTQAVKAHGLSGQTIARRANEKKEFIWV